MKHVENYLNEIGAAPLLTPDEERALAERIAQGDDSAVNELVEKNLRLVVSIAKGYAGNGVEMDDLVSEGNVGLLKAAGKFTDARRRFAVFASGYVRDAIEKASPLYNNKVRAREVAVGTSPKADKALSREDKPTAEERVDLAFEREELRRRMGVLNEREKEVVKGVFGIDSDRLTMAEIGERMGLKRERVRQIRNVALRKLRRATLLLLLLLPVAAIAKQYNVKSPDGRLTAIVDDAKGLTLTVKLGNDVLLPASPVGMELANGAKTRNIKSGKQKELNETINAPFWRQKQISAHANQLTIGLNDGFSMVVRAYNEGVAYRFATSRKGETIVKQETAEFRFGDDCRCWLPYSTNEKNPMAMAFQNIYDTTTIRKAKQLPAFLPVTVDCGAAKVTLLESDLERYPGMFLKAKGDALVGTFAHYPKTMDYYRWRHMSYVKETENFIAKSSGARNYPWRVLAVSERDEQMPVNSLVYALARPNRIGSTDWIRPGKVAWDWWNDWMLRGVDFKAGINEQTYRYFIDFAHRFGLEYIVLDEGWYDSASGDVMNPIKEVNLPALVKYGKEKGVGVVLWSVFNVMDENLEQICKHYADMGIKGFKVDFLDRDDQTAVEMVERLAECCARHHLILDLHGIYKPAGLNRTYPNVLNYESVFGMEEARWTKLENNMPLYDVTFPFIRMMAGQVDFTPGAMRNATKKHWQANYEKPASMGTRAHQAACYVVHDSPFTMLADSPTSYEREPDFTKVIASLPVVFDETRCLMGKIGECIVMARRAGNKWYIGGQTNWDSRTLSLPLTFLDKAGKALVLRDGLNANHDAEDFLIEHREVKAGETLSIEMASGGGFLIVIGQ